MRTIKGPAVFLAQFMRQTAPFDTLDHLAERAAGLGYGGMQVFCDPHLIDLATVAGNKDGCGDLRVRLVVHGIEPTEPTTPCSG